MITAKLSEQLQIQVDISGEEVLITPLSENKEAEQLLAATDTLLEEHLRSLGYHPDPIQAAADYLTELGWEIMSIEKPPAGEIPEGAVY